MNNLSEEEKTIKTIKEKLEIIKSLCTDDCINKSVVIEPLEYAIKGLLDLYNKEKEKNKELENLDLTTIYLNGVYDGEKKCKNKIKEKIKEIEKKELLQKIDFNYCKFATGRLQELLEE